MKQTKYNVMLSWLAEVLTMISRGEFSFLVTHTLLAVSKAARE